VVPVQRLKARWKAAGSAYVDVDAKRRRDQHDVACELPKALADSF
jgi:hypothetical protein